jgi:hypothetical protein
MYLLDFQCNEIYNSNNKLFSNCVTCEQIGTKAVKGATHTDKQIGRKLDILLRYDIAEFCTEWFRVCPNIISKFRNIALLKSKIMIQAKRIGMSMTF